ncbi:MAG: cobyric acid synthase [Lachnospiraceae bacterium]|nr:cobyric acid synthase [Lachnospiraceae bacterium]
MAGNIMVLGSMSGVGKSLVAAGLCRIFRQDGLSPAPFKSQNMALNSCITKEGLEMGRAQVMQAEAAMIEPEAAMNPVLLKPTTDVGSQLIVLGEVKGQMSAGEYMDYKKKLLPEILAAYASLSGRFRPMVIEGAGSPAELNLMENDIVNLGLAERINADAILVGDIDRGGVFAQLLGTLMLLPEEGRRRIKGLVINKFRGDRKIFEPGLKELEMRCGIPVIGVLPYMNCTLTDEDSLSEKLKYGFCHRGASPEETLEIAVIHLPRISNFTDFDVFDCLEGVVLRFVREASELGEPDLIILPGTKSTIADLKWLREKGFADRIYKAVKDTPVLGICGGYQMLGRRISDPYGVEGEKGEEIQGLGLLPADTVMDKKKTRARVTGRTGKTEGIFSALSGKSFEGYILHMGETDLIEPEKSLGTLCFQDGKTTREGILDGNVIGSYVHGILDGFQFLNALLSSVSRARGKSWKPVNPRNYKDIREDEYNRLAREMRDAFRMDLVYEIAGLL